MIRASSLLALLVVLATALLAPAVATAQEEGPVCPADIDGLELGASGPGGGGVQSLRCRYPSDGERSAVILVARYNAPGDEPTFIVSCGGEPRRNEEGLKINGLVFSEVGGARVSWEIGNTNRVYDEAAVVAAAEAFLTTFEDLAIPCPAPGDEPPGAPDDIPAECSEQFDGLDVRVRSRITNRDDVGGVRCIYAGTETQSEVQFVATLNPPGAEPTLAPGCGAEPRSSERDGEVIGTIFSADALARVRYSIIDSSLDYDADAAAVEAAALLSRIEGEAQLCDGTSEPTATTVIPDTTAPGDTTSSPTTANVPDTTAAPVAAPDGGDDGGGSGLVLPIIGGALLVAAAAGGFVWWRRRQMQAAPAAAAPTAPPPPQPPRDPNDPGDTITQPPPPPSA